MKQATILSIYNNDTGVNNVIGVFKNPTKAEKAVKKATINLQKNEVIMYDDVPTGKIL
mgnify:FL=1|jgi:hypothetical protein